MQKQRLAKRLIVLGILLGNMTPLMEAMSTRGVGRSGRTSGFGSRAMARPSRGLRSPYDRGQTGSSNMHTRGMRPVEETRAPRPNAAAGPNSIVTPFACEELAQVSMCICQLKDIVQSGFDVLCSKIESLSFSGLDGLITELEIIASILENLDVSCIAQLCSTIDTLETDLDNLASQNDLIFSKACIIETTTESTNSIVQIIETVLDDTFSKVCTIESIVEEISIQGGSTTDVIISSIEEIQTVVDNIFSKACTIESIVEGLATESIAEAILQKTCTIDSKVDVLQSTVENISIGGSIIESVSSLSEEILQKVCTIDSKVDLLATESIAEEILQKTCTIDSKIDALTIGGNSSTDAIISVIDDLQSTSDDILQKVCTIDSKVDLLATESIAEDILQKVCTIDSKVDTISTGGSSNTDVIISVIDNLQSTSDEILQKVCTIDSKVDLLATESIAEDILQKVCTVDSKVDLILDKACTTESLVEVIDSKVSICDTSLLPIINATTMHIDCAVGSKTDLAATDTGIFSTLDGINDTDISVISWLKTIMRELRGL